MTYIPFSPCEGDPQGERSRGESPKASYAFHVYAALSLRHRSYEGVLEQLVEEGLLGAGSLTQVRRWGRRYAWQERVKAHDAAKIEALRPEWESERILRAKLRADQAGEGYEEAVKLLLERIQSGKLVPSDALVAAIKAFADIEHRDMDVVAGTTEERSKVGIQINIGLDSPDGPATAQSLTFGERHALPEPQVVDDR
jgi:hypothetical protein